MLLFAILPLKHERENELEECPQLFVLMYVLKSPQNNYCCLPYSHTTPHTHTYV